MRVLRRLVTPGTRIRLSPGSPRARRLRYGSAASVLSSVARQKLCLIDCNGICSERRMSRYPECSGEAHTNIGS